MPAPSCEEKKGSQAALSTREPGGDVQSRPASLIGLCYLPLYAPQLNPDEWLNRDLKTKLRTRPATRERDALKRMASSFLHTLASLPQRVTGYFRHEYVAYASAKASNCV